VHYLDNKLFDIVARFNNEVYFNFVNTSNDNGNQKYVFSPSILTKTSTYFSNRIFVSFL